MLPLWDSISVLNRVKRHHLIHTKERAFSCPVCDKRFSRKDRLKEHLSIHGCSAKAKEALGGVETANTTISSDTSHLEIKPAGKFTNMAALEDCFPHPEGAQSSVTDICFCHLCWTQFSEKQLLECHLKQAHESKKPFPCTQCGKRFMYVQKLKEHEAGPEGRKPHQCSQCDKGFQTSKGLENHMQDHTVHTGETPYQCDKCGKSFYYRQGFNNHKKTHSATPIGPTRQLGRPRQMGSTRKSSRPRKISHRALPDSDGEDLTWEPPELGNRPLHHHGNQENHAAENHSQMRENDIM